MNTETLHIYHESEQQFREEQNKLTRLLSFTSMLRLALFLVFAWFVYSAFKVRFEGYDLIYSLIAIIALLVVVSWSETLKKKIKFLQQLIQINRNEIDINNDLPSFLDNGKAFSPAKGFTVDLNVFGSHSLYHSLNRAGSLSGKKSLGARLINPFTNISDIENAQACIKELSGKIVFRQTLLAHTLLFKEEETLSQLQAGIPVQDFAVLKNKTWTAVSILWPLVGILLIVYCAWSGNYGLLLAFIIIGLLVLTLILKKINLL